MSYTAHTEKMRGYTITIEQDEYPTNPRTDRYRDLLGEFIGWDRDYVSPDPVHYEDAEALREYLKERRTDRKSKDAGIVALAVKQDSYTSEYSVIGEWDEDTDPNFVIFVTYEQIRHDQMVRRITPAVRANVIAVLSGEVQEYSDYASGNVWEYAITDDSGAVLGSCCGFSGDWDGGDGDGYLLQEARDEANALADDRDRGVSDEDADTDAQEEIGEYLSYHAA